MQKDGIKKKERYLDPCVLLYTQGGTAYLYGRTLNDDRFPSNSWVHTTRVVQTEPQRGRWETQNTIYTVKNVYTKEELLEWCRVEYAGEEVEIQRITRALCDR